MDLPPPHPGIYVRNKVLPNGMTVTAAARALKIGRPALSRFLSGKAALSRELAHRIEKVFGVSAERLLRLQGTYDAGAAREDPKIASVGPYIAILGRIRQEAIEVWASEIKARARLPVLLRILVHSTGDELTQVNFPGNESSQSPGLDGIVVAGKASPWISEGRSVWEFGCDTDPRKKANKDYRKRTDRTAKSKRQESVFVFVTPRRWPRKRDWVEDRREEGHWKDVRVYDADDLEQWLEQSIPATAWFIEEIGLQTQGVSTLDRFWEDWSTTCNPQISPFIFAEPIAKHKSNFKEWLEAPEGRPYYVSGNTEDEAIAFLSCIARDSEIQGVTAKLGLVFSSVGALKEMAVSKTPLVPIVRSEEAILVATRLYRRRHCIIISSGSQVDTKQDIAIGPLSNSGFKDALDAMALNDQVERLARESGRSPTILRRVLSTRAAVARPKWAKDQMLAESLIPITLTGAWNSQNHADCEVVRLIGNCTSEKVERDIACLLQQDDSPVWSFREYCGVVSRVDSLFAIHKWITKEDLRRFFLTAERVLSEPDPALELPEGKRWAAPLYGKVRHHSERLHASIRETLVILSVYGNDLFGDRLCLDVETEVSSLVERLLTTSSPNGFLVNRNYLPDYAEAAPDLFLHLVQEDLKTATPSTLSLLTPVEDGFLGDCPRTGLLWALECLAWKPERLSLVSLLLAELALVPINDSWANTPLASLESIYSSWMPQTAAGVDERTRSLSTLATRHPGIGWRICIQQLLSRPRIGSFNYVPRWRNDASGKGQVVSSNEENEFNCNALTIALKRTDHDQHTLGDLIACLPRMRPNDRAHVWSLIDKWVEDSNDASAKTHLRDRIQGFMLAPSGLGRGLGEAERTRALEVSKRLEAPDPVTRDLRVFASHWIELDDEANLSAADETIDYDRNSERLHELRESSMQEIWTHQGFTGAKQLLLRGGNPWLVGEYTASCVTGTSESKLFVDQCLACEDELRETLDDCVRAFLRSTKPERRRELLLAFIRGGNTDHTVMILSLAPFKSETWKLVEEQGERIERRYWSEVKPTWDRQRGEELNTLVHRLIRSNRPFDAFDIAKVYLKDIETDLLKRLLLDMASGDPEPRESLHQDSYYISKALEVLQRRPNVTTPELARLELVFIGALVESGHGIPNLEYEISENPSAFAWAVGISSKRKDQGQDPPEWEIKDLNRQNMLTHMAWYLFDNAKRIPGTNDHGEISFSALWKWVQEVREICSRNGRAGIGDDRIGQLLSKDLLRDNEIENGQKVADHFRIKQPSKAVCDVLERISSKKMAVAFVVGVINSRGVQLRGVGGRQERELAEGYRRVARTLVFDYPFVGRVFEEIAKDYEHQAEWWDSEYNADQRLRT